MDYGQQVPAAERTLRLLEALAAAPEGLSAGELMQRLDLSRSSLFALLNTLKARSYIEQRDERGPYYLGPALYALLPDRSRRLSMLVEAFHADGDVAALPETVTVSWLDGDDVVVLAQKEGTLAVRAVLRPGTRRPAAATASGLALLAGQPAAGKHEGRAPTSEDEARLRQVQQRGRAQTENEELVEIAFPICADGVQPVAALALTMPVYRYDAGTAAALAHPLRRAAARLSFRLGAPTYQPYGWATGEPLGPTTTLSREEIDRFLREPWGARLACVRPDGTPHVVPLWYEWDGQGIWLAASPGASWKTYVRENRRVSLTVDEPWPPLRRALIVGDAHGGATVPGGVTGLRQRLAARYLGQGAAQQVSANGTRWEAFRIEPERISGYQGLGEGQSDG